MDGLHYFTFNYLKISTVKWLVTWCIDSGGHPKQDSIINSIKLSFLAFLSDPSSCTIIPRIDAHRFHRQQTPWPQWKGDVIHVEDTDKDVSRVYKILLTASACCYFSFISVWSIDINASLYLFDFHWRFFEQRRVTFASAHQCLPRVDFPPQQGSKPKRPHRSKFISFEDRK